MTRPLENERVPVPKLVAAATTSSSANPSVSTRKRRKGKSLLSLIKL